MLRWLNVALNTPVAALCKAKPGKSAKVLLCTWVRRVT